MGRAGKEKKAKKSQTKAAADDGVGGGASRQEYKPGSIASLLGGKPGDGGLASLFSDAVQAKFEAVGPLPGFDPAIKPDESDKPKLTKKGKVRPPRPLKREREGGHKEQEEEEGGGTPESPQVEDQAPVEQAVSDGTKQLKKRRKKGGDRDTPQAAAPVPPVDSDEGSDAGGSGEEDGAEEETREAELEKEKRTLFVGNLPISMSKHKLKTIFKKYGEIESVRLRSMALAGVKIDDHGNQKLVKKVSANKRMLSDAKDSFNAYVVFKEESSVVAALKANNTVVEEKHIRVDRVGATATRDPKRSVFLGNVPFDAKEEEVRAHFASVMEGGDAAIEAVRLVRDPETQVGKGFGFVLLVDKSSTAQALKVHGTEFKGRELRVTPCGKRNKGGKGSPKIHVKPGAERRIRAAGKTPQNGAKASYEGRRGTDVAKGDAKGIRLKKRAGPHGKGKKSKKKTPAGKAKRR